MLLVEACPKSACEEVSPPHTSFWVVLSPENATACKHPFHTKIGTQSNATFFKGQPPLGVLILRRAVSVIVVEQAKLEPLEPFCTCGSLTAKWTYAFGAHLGLSHASWCLPSYFIHAKLRKLDAVLITQKL